MTDHAEKQLDDPSGIRDDLRWLKRLCVPDGSVITHSEVCLRVDRIVSEVVRSCEREHELQAELVQLREACQAAEQALGNYVSVDCDCGVCAAYKTIRAVLTRSHP